MTPHLPDSGTALATSTVSGAIIAFAAQWLPVVQFAAGTLAVMTGITYFILLYIRRRKGTDK